MDVGAEFGFGFVEFEEFWGIVGWVGGGVSESF